MLLVSGVAFFYYLVDDINNVSQFITMSFCLSDISILKNLIFFFLCYVLLFNC